MGDEPTSARPRLRQRTRRAACPVHDRPANADRGRSGRSRCSLTCRCSATCERPPRLALCSIPGRASAAAPARISCAKDDEDNSAGARYGLRALLLVQENAVVRIELGNCLVLGRAAAARSYGCISVAITDVVLDRSRASSLAEEIFRAVQPPARTAIATLSVVLATGALALVETGSIDPQ